MQFDLNVLNAMQFYDLTEMDLNKFPIVLLLSKCASAYICWCFVYVRIQSAGNNRTLRTICWLTRVQSSQLLVFLCDLKSNSKMSLKPNNRSSDSGDGDEEQEKVLKLFLSVKNGDAVKLQKLIKSGGRIDAVDVYNKDNTLLHYAVEKNKLEIAEQLLLLGDKDLIDRRNVEGDTALHIAVARGGKEIVQLLLKYQARTDLKNEDGETALDVISKDNNVQIFKLLMVKTNEYQKLSGEINDFNYNNKGDKNGKKYCKRVAPGNDLGCSITNDLQVKRESSEQRKINNKVKEEIASIKITNSTLFSKIKNFDVKFDLKSIDLLYLDYSIGYFDKQILHIDTQSKLLTIAKLLQVFTEFDFLDLDDSGSNIWNDDPSVVLINELNNINLLVVNYSSDDKTRANEILHKLTDLLDNNNKKKIILIIEDEYVLTRQLTELKETFYESIKDVNNNLNDLNFISQKNILQKTRIIFQGEEICLDQLVDDKIKYSINAEILNKIISGDQISVGQPAVDSEFELIKNYYVNRNVCKPNINKGEKVNLNNFTGISDDLVILTGEPGMGKSTFLNHLSTESKKCDPTLWIVKINLTQFKTQLKRLELKTDVKEIVSAFYNSDCFSSEVGMEQEDEMDRFRRALFNRQLIEGKVVLLFDEFDEMSSEYKTKFISLVKKLEGMIPARIWIAMRSQNYYNLRLELPEFSQFSLEPFTSEQQKELFNQIWNANQEFDGERLNSFVKKLFEAFGEYLGTPLIDFMVADIYKKDSEQFCLHDAQIPNILKSNLFDIYEKFIIKRYYENCNENDEYEQFISDYRKLGVWAMFTDYEANRFLSREKVNRTISGRIRNEEMTSQLVHNIIEEKLNFYHHTVYEYLVACLLWEKFMTIHLDELDEFTRNVTDVNLSSGSKFGILDFMQSKAKKDFENEVGIADENERIQILFDSLFNILDDELTGNVNDFVKLLFGIVDVCLSRSKMNVLRSCDDKNKIYKLLCVCAEMNYLNLIKIAMGEINKNALKGFIEENEWNSCPLSIAADNEHSEMLQILIDNYSIDKMWFTNTKSDLMKNIFKQNAINVLKYFLKLDLIYRPYYVSSEILEVKSELSLIKAISRKYPRDIIELLIKKTPCFDEFYLYGSLSGTFSENLFSYDEEIIGRVLGAGVQFPQIINFYLARLRNEFINNYLRIGHRSSYFMKHELSIRKIDELLKLGIGYNCNWFHYDQHRTTMHYVSNFNFIYNFCKTVYKLQYTKNVRHHHDPLGAVKEAIIGFMKKIANSKFVVNSDGILLKINGVNISILPKRIQKLYEVYYTSHDVGLLEKTVDLLRISLNNSKDKISKTKSEMPVDLSCKEKIDILVDYFPLETSVHYIKELFIWVIELHLDENYSIEEALESVSQYVLGLKIIKKKSTSNDEIIEALGYNKFKNCCVLKSFLLKFNTQDPVLLRDILHILSTIVGNKRKKKMENILKFLDFSNQLNYLMTDLNGLYGELTSAIQQGNHEKIQEILGRQPDYAKSIMNAQDDDYGSPLHYAVAKGNFKATEILLLLGANPNIRLTTLGKLLEIRLFKPSYLNGQRTCTPLHLAAFAGDRTIVELLISKGSQINADICAKYTPLDAALHEKHEDVADFLSSKGAKKYSDLPLIPGRDYNYLESFLEQ